MGESAPCYAVSLEKHGTTVRGYVSDTTLPAVVEFERKRALESRVAIPEPPPVPPDGEKGFEGPRPLALHSSRGPELTSRANVCKSAAKQRSPY